MKRSLSLRVAAAAGLAAAGVFAGHFLTYALMVDRHAHPLLVDVAHGYLPFAGLIVAVLGFVALPAGVGAGYFVDGTRSQSVWRAARRLAVVQAGAFTALELLERLAVGVSLDDLAGPLLVVGLIVQALVAIVAALVLTGLRRVGQAIASKGRPTAPAGACHHVVVRGAIVTRHPKTSIVVRAPPGALAP